MTTTKSCREPQPHLPQLALTAPVERGSRGRNGVFTVRTVQVYARPATSDLPGFVSVDAYSGRQGDSPPIALGLSLEDALRLGQELIRAVAHALNYLPEQIAALERGDAGVPLATICAEVLSGTP